MSMSISRKCSVYFALENKELIEQIDAIVAEAYSDNVFLITSDTLKVIELGVKEKLKNLNRLDIYKWIFRCNEENNPPDSIDSAIISDMYIIENNSIVMQVEYKICVNRE